MALETTLGGDGTLFIGEDKRIWFGPLSKPRNWDDARDGAYSPPDLSGRTLRFVVRRKDSSADPAIIDKAIGGFGGTYSSTYASNTQRPYVDLTDDEMAATKFKVWEDGSSYRWSLKQMDDGVETILGYGDFSPQQATAR